MSDSLTPTDFSAMDSEATEMAFATVRNPEESKGVSCHFYMDTVENVQKSNEEGRPIFDEVPHVRIQVRGDNSNVIQRPADIDKKAQRRNADNVRFPEQWMRFQAGQKQVTSGTPLARVPWLTKSQVKELEHFDIRSVEDLADLSDEIGGRFMGFHKLKKQAQDYIAQAKGEAPALKLRAELEQRDNLIATLQRQLSEQAARIDTLARKAGEPVPSTPPVIEDKKRK